MSKQLVVKTAIFVMSLDKDSALAIFFDEKAYAQYRAGEDDDNIILNAYLIKGVKMSGDMTILLENGVPVKFNVVK